MKGVVIFRNPMFIFVVQGMLAVETFFALTGILLFAGLKKERLKSRVSVLKTEGRTVKFVSEKPPDLRPYVP